jgi:quercetin dioxygenase-like cupin family protein
MRYLRIVLAGALAAGFGAAALAASGPTIITPSTIKWTAGTGMDKGTYDAVLLGDPSKSGMYVVRVKAPAGTVFGPHYHNETENVTIISGTLWVGLGDKMNRAQMKPLAAGTFVTVPAKLHHYAMTKTDTVFQIEGMGPETMVPLKM